MKPKKEMKIFSSRQYKNMSITIKQNKKKTPKFKFKQNKTN